MSLSIFILKFKLYQMSKKAPLVDKVYKLKNDSAPLSFTLPSRNTKRFPLLWFDEENGVNRPLRYAINQKSPFEDEQDGNAIIEAVIFERGFLSVPRNNPVLQQFLHYHPLNGVAFVEVNYEKDAELEVQMLNDKAEAIIQARELTIDQLELVFRIVFGRDPSRYTSAEMKRDVLVFANREPNSFLEVLNDPQLQLQGRVSQFFDYKLLTFKNSQKEVWFNTPSNKKKMLNVPYGEDPYVTICNYMQTEAGIDALKMLESNLEMMQ
jgi:hypothetical protein